MGGTESRVSEGCRRVDEVDVTGIQAMDGVGDERPKFCGDSGADCKSLWGDF